MKARIVRHGKLKLKLQGGRVRTLPGVLHILELARNLISIGKMDDAGVKIVFERDTYKMVRGALVLVRGVQIGTLYKFQGSTIIDVCNSSVIPESGAENLVVSGEKNMLWHERLCNIGEKGLQILQGKGMSNRSLYFDFYENCVYGKQNRVSIPSGSKRVKQILELLHSDVFGPMKVPSLVRERMQRERYSPSSFCSKFSLSITDDDPITMKEEVDSEDGKLWKEAMVDEMASLHKNEAWDLVELSDGRKPIGSKWVFKKKTNAKGKVEKYKAQLVAKGYS
eukprot:PITA_19366